MALHYYARGGVTPAVFACLFMATIGAGSTGAQAQGAVGHGPVAINRTPDFTPAEKALITDIFNNYGNMGLFLYALFGLPPEYGAPTRTLSDDGIRDAERQQAQREQLKKLREQQKKLRAKIRKLKRERRKLLLQRAYAKEDLKSLLRQFGRYGRLYSVADVLVSSSFFGGERVFGRDKNTFAKLAEEAKNLEGSDIESAPDFKLLLHLIGVATDKYASIQTQLSEIDAAIQNLGKVALEYETQINSRTNAAPNYYTPPRRPPSTRATRAITSASSGGRTVQMSRNKRWLIWATGTYFDINKGGSLDRKGNGQTFTGGIAYQWRPNLRIGASIRYSNARTNSRALFTTLKTQTFDIALFTEFTLRNDIKLTLLGAYEKGDNNISITGFTGSYDTNAFTLAARVSRVFRVGANGWWVRPSATLAWSQIRRDTYVNTASRTIPGSTLNFAAMIAGIEAGKSFALDGPNLVSMTPTLAVDGIFLVKKPSFGTIATTGANLSIASSGIRATGALTALFSGGASAAVRASYTAMSDGARRWALSGNLSKPF